jgi:hypothetical protein
MLFYSFAVEIYNVNTRGVKTLNTSDVDLLITLEKIAHASYRKLFRCTALNWR